MTKNIWTQMPEYRCHKVVRASKIVQVIPGDHLRGRNVLPVCLWADLYLLEPSGAQLRVTGEFCALHKPQAGGYLVWYENGYLSYSPAKAFTDGYSLIEDPEAAGFSDALMWLKEGKKIARKGWNGKGLWLELQRPDADSKMTLPYIFINYPDAALNTPGARVPWAASQTDMLADDWLVVK